MELREIPINKIQPNPLQPRETFDREKIKELANSIKEADLLQPIIIWKKNGRYEIVGGERRWRAFKILNKKTIPCIIWKAKDDIDALEKGTIENWHRLDLTDKEKSRVISELWKSGKYETVSEMSRKTGINKSSIGEYLDTTKLKARLPQISEASHTRIRATVGLPDRERIKLIKRSEKEDISARELEERIVPLIKKAPESIKDAVLERGLGVETAERIMEIERPSVRERVLEKAVHGKLTPSMVSEEARKIELHERKLNIEHPEESYNELVDSLTNLENAMKQLEKMEIEGMLSKNQINGMARSLYVFMSTTLPKFANFLVDNGAKVDPRFAEYLKKFR